MQPSKESTINTPSLTPSQPQAPHSDSSNTSPSLVPMVPRSELFFIRLLGGTRTPNLMIRSHALYPIGLQGVNKIGFYRIITPPPTTIGGRSFCYLTASISAYASASHFRRLVTSAYSISFRQASLTSARCFNTPGY